MREEVRAVDIGKEKEKIVVEPAEDPFERPAPEPEPEREKVPA
jgi:hypothetical protein